MTPPPYLTQAERVAVERALRAAGFVPSPWAETWQRRDGQLLDLRVVFPTPFSSLEPAGVARCVCPQPAGDDPACPVHGEAS